MSYANQRKMILVQGTMKSCLLGTTCIVMQILVDDSGWTSPIVKKWTSFPRYYMYSDVCSKSSTTRCYPSLNPLDTGILLWQILQLYIHDLYTTVDAEEAFFSSGRFRITRKYWKNISSVVHALWCYEQIQILNHTLVCYPSWED